MVSGDLGAEPTSDEDDAEEEQDQEGGAEEELEDDVSGGEQEQEQEQELHQKEENSSAGKVQQLTIPPKGGTEGGDPPKVVRVCIEGKDVGPLTRSVAKMELWMRGIWRKWGNKAGVLAAILVGWSSRGGWVQDDGSRQRDIIVIQAPGANSTEGVVVNMTDFLLQSLHAQVSQQHQPGSQPVVQSTWDATLNGFSNNAAYFWGWLQGRGPDTQSYNAWDVQLLRAQHFLTQQTLLRQQYQGVPGYPLPQYALGSGLTPNPAVGITPVGPFSPTPSTADPTVANNPFNTLAQTQQPGGGLAPGTGLLAAPPQPFGSPATVAPGTGLPAAPPQSFGSPATAATTNPSGGGDRVGAVMDKTLQALNLIHSLRMIFR